MTKTNIAMFGAFACLILLRLSLYFSTISFALYISCYISAYILPYLFIKFSAPPSAAKSAQSSLRYNFFLSSLFLSAMIVFSLAISFVFQNSSVNSYSLNIKSFLLTGLLTPILEELFWRKAFAHTLCENGSLCASALSAVLFALLHSGSVALCYAVFAGVLLAVLYFKTKSIVMCIFVHMVNNITALLSARFSFVVFAVLLLAVISFVVLHVTSEKQIQQANDKHLTVLTPYFLKTPVFYATVISFLLARYGG